jgi:hypothetical protein
MPHKLVTGDGDWGTVAWLSATGDAGWSTVAWLSNSESSSRAAALRGGDLLPRIASVSDGTAAAAAAPCAVAASSRPSSRLGTGGIAAAPGVAAVAVCCSALRRQSTATYSAYTRTRTHTTVTQLQHEREHPATRADREAVVFRLPRGRDDSECACVSRHRRSVERYCGCDVYNCRGHLAARSGFGVAGACDHRRRQQRIRITPQVTSTARLAFVGWRLSCGRHTRETTRSQKPPQWRAAVARKTDAHSSQIAETTAVARISGAQNRRTQQPRTTPRHPKYTHITRARARAGSGEPAGAARVGTPASLCAVAAKTNPRDSHAYPAPPGSQKCASSPALRAWGNPAHAQRCGQRVCLDGTA